MSDTERRNFGQLLAYHTAPTLLGKKCASLVRITPFLWAEFLRVCSLCYLPQFVKSN